MAQISKRVRECVMDRLRTGWLLKLNEVANDYAVSATDLDRLRSIDWQGNRKQVFQGQIDPDSIANSTTVVYPIVRVFTGGSVHDGTEKFQLFSGTVPIDIEFIFSWRDAAALPNFEETADLVEGTMVALFHNRLWIGITSNGVVYNGEFTHSRGAIVEAAEHWQQTLGFRLVFGVDV
jgi:hypothetical protein